MSRILARCTAAAPIASAITTAGCAGGRSGATPSTTTPVNLAPITQRVMRTDGSIVDVNAAPLTAGLTTRVRAPIDSAWAALKAAYSEFGIPAPTLLDASHMLENGAFTTRRRIGKGPMPKILDCGSSQGIPNAESFDVRMAISSYLTKNPAGGVDFVTRVAASGVSPYFAGGAPVNCTSLGKLERVIAEMVRKKSGS